MIVASALNETGEIRNHCKKLAEFYGYSEKEFK